MAGLMHNGRQTSYTNIIHSVIYEDLWKTFSFQRVNVKYLGYVKKSVSLNDANNIGYIVVKYED